MTDLFDLTGRVAVVTGGAGLLGKRHVEALSAAGASVVVADLDGARAGDTVAALATRDGSAPFALDVTRPASVEALRDFVLARYGRLDVLVNNAAIDDKVESPVHGAEASRFESYPLETWRRVLEVNATGVFLVSQVLGTEMARRGAGSIVNVASTYGLVGPDQALYRRADGTQEFYKSPAYPASKGAVLAFTRFLAAYWGSAGVRVNALAPGGVANGQDAHFVEGYARRTPLGRMAAPDDYRGALLFLASDASRYMTGATLVVDGGFTAW
jgi:NAD(P)-dependent dehydrogenase (short-subunit alcohol dehydrogenase family)